MDKKVNAIINIVSSYVPYLGTRWASWNIGIFLCIRCGGLHRSLGTHISKVKSVTLDKWTDEQVEVIIRLFFLSHLLSL